MFIESIIIAISLGQQVKVPVVEAPVKVVMAKPGPVREMWSPKPQVVLIDHPVEKRKLYE